MWATLGQKSVKIVREILSSLMSAWPDILPSSITNCSACGMCWEKSIWRLAHEAALCALHLMFSKRCCRKAGLEKSISSQKSVVELGRRGRRCKDWRSTMQCLQSPRLCVFFCSKPFQQKGAERSVLLELLLPVCPLPEGKALWGWKCRCSLEEQQLLPPNFISFDNNKT